jgi:hypothetical protein
MLSTLLADFNKAEYMFDKNAQNGAGLSKEILYVGQ